MSRTILEQTHYLNGEGRRYMEECASAAFQWSVAHNIGKIVMFTGTGDGPLYAVRHLLVRDEFAAINVVAVTPPMGRPYADPSNKEMLVHAGIPRGTTVRELLTDFGIPIVSAHLPFKEIHDGKERSSAWSRVAEAFGVLGGGFALCVQAVLMACDAGEVRPGEKVVAMTADTAISVIATRTEWFLSPDRGLLVEHIICRPCRYNVSRPNHHLADDIWGMGPAFFDDAGDARQLTLPEPAPSSATEDSDSER